MNPQTRYVGFDGHQLAVESADSKVLSFLEQDFRLMLQDQALQPFTRLLVGSDGETYFLKEGDLVCTDGQSLESITGILKTEVILRFIHARPDLLWLHAGSAALQGKALLVSGGSGRGKSTIVTGLCEAGWSYLSDDIIPLNPLAGRVYPFPTTPYVRIHRLKVNLPPEQVQELEKIEAEPATLCRELLPIAALIFPHFNPHLPTQITPCSPGTAALEILPNCMNLPDRRESAFHQLCDVIKRIPTFRLSFSFGDVAAKMIIQALQKEFPV